MLNQLAAPGLGTILAGERVRGALQLLLAAAGFLLWMTWCLLIILNAWRLYQTGAEPEPVAKYAFAGVGLFGSAWFWSLFTSRRILRQASQNEPDL